jgi:hypothetical protein
MPYPDRQTLNAGRVAITLALPVDSRAKAISYSLFAGMVALITVARSVSHVR